MIIYLYVKTHRITGLKYLGKTTSKDPHKYPGSGVYWTRHLEEHGYDVDTEIIYECRSNDELSVVGLYYSNLWDIVNAVDETGRKIWANLKPEEGSGGWGGDQNPNNLPHIKEEKRKRLLTDNPIHMPGVKEKVSENTKKAMMDPVIRERFLNGIHSDSWMNARKNRVGCNAPNFDATIYTWQHKNGTIITCTKYDLEKNYGASAGKLVKRKIKTSKGWFLI